MPLAVTDRDADVWESLIIIADQVGGHWPESARVAAVTAVTDSQSRKESLGVTLLRDLRDIFNRLGEQRIVTDLAITNLKEIEEGPWATIRKGEPIDSRRLASLLRKYGIEPKPHRDGGRVFKGYSRAQFEDAWSRYLEPAPVGSPRAQSVTSVTEGTETIRYPERDGSTHNSNSGAQHRGSSTPESNDAYRAGLCVDCREQPHSAGRPRCDECHAALSLQPAERNHQSTAEVSHALDTRPILGEIARQWQRIHPHDLTMPEALTLLGVLYEITERLDTAATRGRGLKSLPTSPTDLAAVRFLLRRRNTRW